MLKSETEKFRAQLPVLRNYRYFSGWTICRICGSPPFLEAGKAEAKVRFETFDSRHSGLLSLPKLLRIREERIGPNP